MEPIAKYFILCVAAENIHTPPCMEGLEIPGR